MHNQNIFSSVFISWTSLDVIFTLQSGTKDGTLKRKVFKTILF